MVDPAVTELLGRHARIEAEAREEKRASARHRRRARALQRELDYIRAECERLGITLVITQTRKESQ